MELLIIAALIFMFIIMAGASTQAGGYSYGYLTLPTGKVIEGRVSLYQEDSKRGIARIRIGGRTYSAPISAIVLVR